MRPGFDTLAAAACRRIAHGDLAGLWGSIRREVRTPTTGAGRVLHRLYRRPAALALRLAHHVGLQRPADRVLHLFYDLEVAPITFDFAWTLASANVTRSRLGLDAIRVVIVPGPLAGGRKEQPSYDSVFDVEAREWRLWNVLVPLCQSLPTLDSVTVCRTRSQASAIFVRDAVHLFPEHYNPTAPFALFNETALTASRAADIAVFRAPQEARRYADRWIDRHCPGRKLVVITLRESRYTPERNSNIGEWQQFCARLDPAYHVALIPDTDAAVEFSLSGWGKASVLKEASFNLQIRHAFYEAAGINLAVDCGPMILALLNASTTFAQFVKVCEDVPIVNPRYLARRGFQVGETPFFCTPRQRWIWSEDRADLIEAAFHALAGTAAAGIGAASRA